jgi:hypothetical protein
MLGNRALQAGVVTTTATGTTTLGFAPGNTSPADLVVVSAATAATIVLPVISLTATALGAGGNQLFRVQTLGAGSVQVIASGTDSMLGTTTTFGSGCRTCISNSANNTWYQF